MDSISIIVTRVFFAALYLLTMLSLFDGPSGESE